MIDKLASIKYCVIILHVHDTTHAVPLCRKGPNRSWSGVDRIPVKPRSSLVKPPVMLAVNPNQPVRLNQAVDQA